MFEEKNKHVNEDKKLLNEKKERREREMAKGKRDRTPCSVSVANRLHYQQHNDTITRSCSCMTEVSEVTSPRRVLYDP